jgi:hypothetical protein
MPSIWTRYTYWQTLSGSAKKTSLRLFVSNYMPLKPGPSTSHMTRRLVKKSQISAWRAKLVLFAVFSNVAVTHSVPFVELNFSSPSRAVLRNSFSFPVHQPNELVHLSESPDVQKRVPFGIFNSEKINEISWNEKKTYWRITYGAVLFLNILFFLVSEHQPCACLFHSKMI